jgi:hypothetical protein
MLYVVVLNQFMDGQKYGNVIGKKIFFFLVFVVFNAIYQAKFGQGGPLSKVCLTTPPSIQDG